eukprot:gnl/TRDRNA2_/TRDRNA2_171137_c0_seq5.p1 gnl/TRDRNA2_/TRDRNA2_171137_c0~~gnl/TRDRNA2_/TRDRNA2_171137_c0_seq5.p1  ORF type:complete len:308 (+),score=59.67 gnl/TRDRNA2_/TRDRNA2_171137_c0_seq5:124-1047(+)
MWGLFELLCELSGCMSGLLALCRLFASVENTVEAVEEAVEDAVEKPVEALCEAYLKDPVEKGLEQPFDEVQPMLHEMLHAMLHEMLHCDRKKLEEVLKEVRKEPQHVLMDVAKISLPTAKKLLVKAATAKKPKLVPVLVKLGVSWEDFLQIFDKVDSFDKAHALYLDIVASAGQPDQLCKLLAKAFDAFMPLPKKRCLRRSSNVVAKPLNRSDSVAKVSEAPSQLPHEVWSNIAHHFAMQQNQQQPTQQLQQRSHAASIVPADGLHLSRESTNGAPSLSPRLGSFPCLACCSHPFQARRPNTEIAIF